MRRGGACLLLVLIAAGHSGCQWLRPRSASPTAQAAEMADLRLERKLLKEELNLAHREQTDLRRVLERGDGGDERMELLAAQLAAAQAALRERPAALAPAPAVIPTELLERVAQLESAVSRLTTDLTAAQAESVRWREAARASEQSLLAVNRELLAERDARRVAEARLATAERAPIPDVAAVAPAAVATAEVPQVAAPPPLPAPATPAVPGTARSTHVVTAGDTLTSIAMDHYGEVERWRDIYAANTSLLRGDRPLEPGMRLTLPAAPPSTERR